MALALTLENGTLAFSPDGAEPSVTVDVKGLDWDPDRNFTVSALIPCFTGGGFPLYADLLVRSDAGCALAVVLTGYPLEEEETLRTVADIYSNSAKRQYGQRPAVYFLEGNRCKAAYGLLGEFDEQPQCLPKEKLEGLIAAHNIQEHILFHALLQDPKLAEQFLSGGLDTEKTKAMLEEKLFEAREGGFAHHYLEVLCPTAELRQELPKQALLLAVLGEEGYLSLCREQIEKVRAVLSPKCETLLRESDAAGAWLPDPTMDGGENRQLDWAFAYLGWDRAKDLKKNQTVPCYLEPSMELMADYVFLDPNGKPILVFLRDDLQLEPERAFVIGEYYCRSFKAAFGISPFVVIRGEKGAHLKMGALSGGFAPIQQSIPKAQLAVHVAFVNVTEDRAWQTLLAAVPELQTIRDPQQRLQRQLALIQESAKQTGEELKDPNRLREEFNRVSGETALLEETFWKRLLGEGQYRESRKPELQLVRTFAADKRIAGSAQDS